MGSFYQLQEHPGLHWRYDGNPEGTPVVLIHSLGTDLRLWDSLVKLLPDDLYLLRLDIRGHGLSDAPEGAYSIEQLAGDIVAWLDGLHVDTFIVMGVSIGGLISQFLAYDIPDRVQAAILIATAMRMGSAELWQQRIDTVKVEGVAAISDGVIDRWFPESYRATQSTSLWRNMLERTPAAGYIGCCHALANADLNQQTPKIGCPVLVIAGELDQACPAKDVEFLADRLTNAQYHCISRAGHLPSVDTTGQVASLVNDFLRKHAYV